LSGKIGKIMKLNGRIRRMDSMMIESNIRFLSRMELIYTCISKLVVYLTKKQPDMVSEPLKHYADPNDYNRIFYHQRNDDM
ncbi:transposase, partial [bacterium 1xD42-62]|nr:transposase [Parablautia muri]